MMTLLFEFELFRKLEATSKYSWSRFCAVNDKQLPDFPLEARQGFKIQTHAGGLVCRNCTTVALTLTKRIFCSQIPSLKAGESVV